MQRSGQLHLSRPEFARRVAIGVAIGVGIGVVVLVAWLAWRLALLAFAGVLLAVLIRSGADWLRNRTGIGDGAAVTAVVLVLLLLVAGGGALVGTRVARETGELLQAVTTIAEQARARLAASEWGRWMLDQARESGAPVTPDVLLRRVTGYAGTALGALVDLLVVTSVALYLAAAPRRYVDGVVRLVPAAQRRRARRLLAVLGETIRHWLVGRLLAMLLVGAVVGVGLWVLGVRLALPLALLAFVLELIPTVGPFIAAVPAVLIAAPDGMSQAALVAALYLGVQLLEGYVLTPLIEQRTVDLPPALTILVLVLLGSQAGALGALVAAPLLAIALVVAREVSAQGGGRTES